MQAGSLASDFLQWMSILAAFVFLTVGSVSDYRHREVSDRLWLVFAPVGGVLSVARFAVDASLWFIAVVSIVATAVISLLLYYGGLYGGADAKALICLAITVPLVPGNFTPLVGHLHPVFPLSVLYNSYLIAFISTIVLFVYNAYQFLKFGANIFEGYENEPIARKFVLMLTGYRVSIERLSESIHLYPLEQPTGASDRPRKLRLFVSAESDRDEEIAQLKAGIPARSNVKIWATPGLPLLIFITAGFVLVVLVGDLLMWAMFAAIGAL